MQHARVQGLSRREIARQLGISRNTVRKYARALTQPSNRLHNHGVNRTRDEIEETLNRYGADGFAYANQSSLATAIFVMENRRIRFVLKLPDPEEFRYDNPKQPRLRGAKAQQEAT